MCNEGIKKNIASGTDYYNVYIYIYITYIPARYKCPVSKYLVIK